MTVIRRLAPAPAPLDALAAVAHLPGVAFLDGAAEPGGMGRWSYLAAEPAEVLSGSAEDWPEAVARMRASRETRDVSLSSHVSRLIPPFRGGWIGWLSYELGRAFDRQPRPARDDFHIPDFSLARHESVIAWDHLNGECWQVGDTGSVVELVGREPPGARRGQFLSSHVSRDFTRDEYLTVVGRVIDYVLAGDIFQANLSQRFTAPFAGDPLALYAALRCRAAGSHAAYIDRGRVQLLSMSPERFLQYDPESRRVETRPIKGTRPRDHHDAARDTALAADLVTSAKDRAENVMIVDLLRNDLHRVCEAGSVVVPSLCRLESHAAVHHLVSVIQGTLSPACDALDLIAATFPGGSITGAPKLRAMDIIAELEPVTRGVYCGAIGWIGHDGALDLNIAIRTVTLVDGTASIHAGGGITALSDPAAEHQETLDKAQALLDALAEVS